MHMATSSRYKDACSNEIVRSVLKSSKLIKDSLKVLCSLQEFIFATSGKFTKMATTTFYLFTLARNLTTKLSNNNPFLPRADYIVISVETFIFFRSVLENSFNVSGGSTTSQFVSKDITEFPLQRDIVTSHFLVNAAS